MADARDLHWAQAQGDKAALRRYFSEQAALMSKEEQAAESWKQCYRLWRCIKQELTARETAFCVGAYFPLIHEPDLALLFERIIYWNQEVIAGVYKDKGYPLIHIYIPRVVDRTAALSWVRLPEDFRLSTLQRLGWAYSNYGLLEGPLRDAKAAEDFCPDLLLVPVVGCSVDGTRLGHGAGYYDRTLQLRRRKGCSFEAWASLYDCQLVDYLPREGWDMPMDAWVTPKRLRRLSEYKKS